MYKLKKQVVEKYFDDMIKKKGIVKQINNDILGPEVFQKRYLQEEQHKKDSSWTVNDIDNEKNNKSIGITKVNEINCPNDNNIPTKDLNKENKGKKREIINV